MRANGFGTKSLSHPVTRNKLLPVCRKLLISSERGPSQDLNSVGTKFLSLSVAEKQTSSGLTEFFDFLC